MNCIAKRFGSKRAYPQKGNTQLLSGVAVFLAAGLAVAHSAAAANSLFVGVATEFSDATGLSDGAMKVEVDSAEIKFANVGDITPSHVGSTAYFASANKLSSNSSTNTRVPAGVITQVDDDGVWVKPGV
ncbi:hypothetical protein LPO95_001500 [Vibrio cholerae]|nr:hypothetical protein [Vibrio cholerae]